MPNASFNTKTQMTRAYTLKYYLHFNKYIKRKKELNQ